MEVIDQQCNNDIQKKNQSVTTDQNNVEDDQEINYKKQMSDKELDDTLKYLEKHPLFMKEMPENIQDNPDLEALQNLLYDDTPENLAKHFNEKGNEIFKKGTDHPYYIKEALKTYTEGIQANSSDSEVNSKLFCNRALLQFKQKNYGRCIEDCKQAIKYNEKNIKAYYRCAQAMMFLQKFDESLSMLSDALKIDQSSSEIQKLKTEVISKQNIFNNKLKEQKDQQTSEINQLHQECIIRKIYVGNSVMDFPDQCRKSLFLDNNKNLFIPVFIQYPEFSQMDYIEKVYEHDILKNQLNELFGENGLPYDNEKIYNINNIEVYIELNSTQSLYQIKDIQKWPKQRGYQKINIDNQVLQIITTPGFILPQVLEIVIVCPDSKQFYNQFKENFAFIK